MKIYLSYEDCKNNIKNINKIEPIPNGCWFCPYQKDEYWLLLRHKHPELYEKAKILEKLCK